MMEQWEAEQEGVIDYVNKRSKLEEEDKNKTKQLKMSKYNTVGENHFIEGQTEWEGRKLLIKIKERERENNFLKFLRKERGK